jgi:FO synthase subunit 1
VSTRACFNACTYCSFRRPIHPDDPLGDALSDGEAQDVLRRRPQASEVLLLSGELPWGSPARGAWMARLLALSRLALAEGRLPHTNAGPLAAAEMAALARLNPSMGLMLEGLGPAYEALHRQAPSKRLAVRIGQLVQAGRLGIPFTTGLLLGVGETARERLAALELLAHLQRRWGHIQEVILQPWRPGSYAQKGPRPLSRQDCEALLPLIAQARALLPPEVHLQIPANLWPMEALPAALSAGIDDLGGLDLTDVINPAYPQPDVAILRHWLAAEGWMLKPRLCVHQAWIPHLPEALRRQVRQVQATLQQFCC